MAITRMCELCDRTGRSCPKNARKFAHNILKFRWKPRHMLIADAEFDERLAAYNNGTLEELLRKKGVR